DAVVVAGDAAGQLEVLQAPVALAAVGVAPALAVTGAEVTLREAVAREADGVARAGAGGELAASVEIARVVAGREPAARDAVAADPSGRHAVLGHLRHALPARAVGVLEARLAGPSPVRH